MSSTTEIRERLIAQLATKLTQTVPEAAALLGCSERAIYNLLGNGKLESYKHGPRRKIPTSAILKYIEHQVEELQ